MIKTFKTLKIYSINKTKQKKKPKKSKKMLLGYFSSFYEKAFLRLKNSY